MQNSLGKYNGDEKYSKKSIPWHKGWHNWNAYQFKKLYMFKYEGRSFICYSCKESNRKIENVFPVLHCHNYTLHMVLKDVIIYNCKQSDSKHVIIYNCKQSDSKYVINYNCKQSDSKHVIIYTVNRHFTNMWLFTTVNRHITNMSLFTAVNRHITHMSLFTIVSRHIINISYVIIYNCKQSIFQTIDYL